MDIQKVSLVAALCSGGQVKKAHNGFYLVGKATVNSQSAWDAYARSLWTSIQVGVSMESTVLNMHYIIQIPHDFNET